VYNPALLLQNQIGLKLPVPLSPEVGRDKSSVVRGKVGLSIEHNDDQVDRYIHSRLSERPDVNPT